MLADILSQPTFLKRGDVPVLIFRCGIVLELVNDADDREHRHVTRMSLSLGRCRCKPIRGEVISCLMNESCQIYYPAFIANTPDHTCFALQISYQLGYSHLCHMLQANWASTESSAYACSATPSRYWSTMSRASFCCHDMMYTTGSIRLPLIKRYPGARESS